MDMDIKEKEYYQIVGSQEADPMGGRISEESPFGKALLGKREGDEVVVEAPAGSMRYQILEIQR
jgi:transcription elongation factor GreA